MYAEITETLLVARSCFSNCNTIAFDRGTSICQPATASADCTCTTHAVSKFESVFPDRIEQQLRSGDYCVIGDELFVGDPEFDSAVAIAFLRVPNPPPDESPSLMGAEVHYTGHCCSGSPSEQNRTTERMTAQVTPAVEFPAFGSYGLGRNLVPGWIFTAREK